MQRSFKLAIVALTSFGMLGIARAAETPAPHVRSIKLLPDTLTLLNGRDARKVVVMGETDAGKPVDLTADAKFQTDGVIATVADDGYLHAKSKGQTKITVTAAGQMATVSVTVNDTKVPPVGFVRDIEPIMARVGCNAGTCHGAAAGKEGFKLSLRGYDPDFDYQALINDLGGRRFNREKPDKSLMLLKPTGGVPHEGGRCIHQDSDSYHLLRDWIAQGTKYEDPAARATSVDVLPAEVYLDLPNMSQQVLVLAHYRDGTTRDVTREAVITSSNTEVASVKDNTITALRRGEGSVLVRYEGNYAAQRVICMGDRTGYAWQDKREYNYIDKHVNEKLRAMQILPSPLCTDAEFIRRVSLDLTGLPPTADRVKSFLADPAYGKLKRERLVDELIGSPAFVEYWSNKWADLLQCNSKVLGQKAVWTFRAWIEGAIASNMPYDQFVRTLLLAKGSSFANPEVNYLRALRDADNPGKVTEDVTQTFLGVRFNCNRCHDHPFERWTQNQYYEFTSYFNQIAYKKGRLPEEQIVYSGYEPGQTLHPKTLMMVSPQVPYGHAADVATLTDRRKALVDWLTSPQNPLFAKSMANRVWSYFFGVGIIDPVDDIRAGNPPSNPALLDALTADFVAGKFDVRRLMKTIVTSRTYQLSIATSKWNEDDKINFSHALPRRLSAEQLVDAVAVATGHSPKFKGMPAGCRAVELPDGTVEGAEVLGLFGRPLRTSACECERSKNFSLSHAISMVNGATIGDAVSAPDSRIIEIVKTQPDNRKVIEDLYVAILNREPTEKETSEINLGQGPGRLATAQDLAWALLNSPAFLYNR